MEDLRDAEKTVSEFARLINGLRPDCNTSHAAERPPLAANHRDSSESQKTTKTIIGSRWRPKNSKKDWDATIEGILWNELEQPQNKVAQRFKIDQTALKEYISSLDMMDLGCEFARHYYVGPGKEQAYWAAEDLFFDLQAVKQGDARAGRWADAKVYKKDWDLADHLVRFVLLAEQCRLCSGQETWVAWQWDFATNVAFYLSVLRCYTIRDAKQKQLARATPGSPPLSCGSKGSKSGRSSPVTRNGKKE